ncbi:MULTISPECIES: heme ABC transporter ATP-binding protein [unclassified Shinella]|jgi:iron complex transport system ATP-binding protein|uniref:heme ABC transporter ATP-binding protein n=1 Tax=unclassified Shinella TaxID=2643062 RepID=UPI00067FE6A0|nr:MULTISPECIES: heme ABC transporter ATP-binding protein [unclassified Shinella]KNY16497.1 iron ABC transporter [Shinella sp. SUS2]KOC76958.1 iron ABC transporter [Shinella sp. GWS1]MCO5150871.1 heme ABC transporter ATP-binding protein [Shinella sp.]MDC7263118.1 heme ABC transporter ATP-binding protein [Shinella sp. HY16]MDC7270013.1 heme ABC transporter ATP-binding protein [Shinella sp. YZ44]
MITARNLSVSLSGKTIVHGVSLEAKAGQLTAIVGPNGSGKTTMMKAVAGELPSKGEITINGHALAALEPWQLAVKRAVLPQAATIAFPFTVREIVRLGLTVGPNRHAERIDAITAEALAAVDLAGFAGRFYQELSGGEQQRVQLARVLSQIWEPVLDGEPCFLMLDEPVSALDIRHQLTIMTLARRYCESGGGVIAVMHDLNLTAMFADHMVMMRSGRIERAGPPADVMTDDAMEAVFGCRMRINGVPATGVPFVLPHTASA